MSKLSILCVLNLIASFANAVPGGIRAEDLAARGFETQAVGLRVTKFVSTEDISGPYSGEVVDFKVQASPIAVPSNIENTLVLGSPACLINTHIDGQRSIEARFNVFGECVLKSDKEFVCFLSNLFYLPRSNDILLQVYDNSSSKLLQEFMNALKEKPAHFITWRLPDGQGKLQLLYSGAPWTTPIYADVLHVPQNRIEEQLLTFQTPRGITLDDMIKSKVSGEARITTDNQGNFTAGFLGSADGEGKKRFIVNALLSRMPADTAIEVRTNELGKSIMEMFDPEFKEIKDYIGYIRQDLGRLTTGQQGEVTEGELAYRNIYSILFHTIERPFGTVLSIDDVLKKLGDKR